MSNKPYNRKVNNYQTQKFEVSQAYLELRSRIIEEDDSDHKAEYAFDALLEYDEIAYEYKVLITYLEGKRQKYSVKEIELLNAMESAMTRIEKKLPIPMLISRVQELALVRRNLFDNAQEAPKLLNLYENTIPGIKKFIEPTEIIKPVIVKPKEKALTAFVDSTWSPNHVKIVLDSVLKFRTLNERCNYMKDIFEEKFSVNLSPKMASYFLLHYGFRDSGCKLDLYNKTMTEGYALNRNIPLRDRIERIAQYFKSQLNIDVTKNDIEQASKFRRVLMNTYFKYEEPVENYEKVLKHAPYLNESLIPLEAAITSN
ncbi:uncharacterized protein RJT21DRAFT_117414 [Scheffersomyces amazonensis]|uniref:uncharacterized protein n=1 Tax=Scheffersomyces amazonensis TaxID=1078765 RepID=UPI00315DDEA8